MGGPSAAELLDQLDERQRAAVTAGQGRVRVMAGAGTGKTRVLTTRLAWLALERGQEPRRMLATTFTNKAAREIADRAAALGGGALAGVRVGTLHSLAARLLRAYWEAAGFSSPDFTIADDDETREIMAMAVAASGVVGPDTGDAEHKMRVREYVKEVSARIGRWKENGLTLEMVLDPGRPRRGLADEDAARVYVAYQAELTARNMVDFGDLTMKAVALLEGNPAVRERVSEGIDYMMVDEFQDTNRIQLRFIELLVSRWGNLMVVGDDDQSLYSFRGAAGDLMSRMGGPGVTDVALETNRRCTDEILAPANLLVDYNPREAPKVLRSGRSGAPVAVKGYPTDVLEAEGVARDVRALLDSGVPAGEIAILVRSGYIVDQIVKKLVEFGVVHAVQSGGGFLDRTEVKDVLAYLKLALNPQLDVAFERIVAKPSRKLGPAACAAILGLARSTGMAIHDACVQFSLSPQVRADARASAATLGHHLSMLAAAAKAGESSEDIVRYVLDAIDYADWARRQADAPKTLKSSIDGLVALAKLKTDFIDFVTDLSLLSEAADDPTTDAVHLGTIHGSKGLEWDHVFLPAFEEGVFPNPRAIEEAGRGDPDDPWNVEGGGGLEEERRIAHVALTRARHTASVSFAVVRGVGPMRREAKPSRFLREAELPIPRVTQSFAAAQAALGKAAGKKRKGFL
jgi:DNA helicase-2/ATP-dependent DNA helicase PcrA